MTAPGTERRGVGARKMYVFALDANGDIESTTTTAYEGLEIVGIKTLNLTDPEPRTIYHTGDDVVLEVDRLPATESITGTFVISGVDDELDALATPVNSVTEGEVRFMLVGTEQRGNEEQVGVIVFRQSLDASGNRCWESRIFPKCLITPIANGMDENPEEHTYSITPQFSDKHLWETDFSTTTEGAEKAQVVRMVTRYKPKIVKFNGNNTTTEFTFPTSFPAVDTTHIDVFVDGTIDATVTKATTSVQFTTAPTTNANIVVRYEYS